MGRTLEEQLNGEDAEAWIPEAAGESVFGEVEQVVTRDGDYGEYPVVTVYDESSGAVWNIAGFGMVLQGKINELNPQPGDKLGVKFLGEKVSKKGATYKDWKLVIVRKDAEPVKVPDVPSFNDED